MVIFNINKLRQDYTPNLLSTILSTMQNRQVCNIDSILISNIIYLLKSISIYKPISKPPLFIQLNSSNISSVVLLVQTSLNSFIAVSRKVHLEPFNKNSVVMLYFCIKAYRTLNYIYLISKVYSCVKVNILIIKVSIITNYLHLSIVGIGIQLVSIVRIGQNIQQLIGRILPNNLLYK